MTSGVRDAAGRGRASASAIGLLVRLSRRIPSGLGGSRLDFAAAEIMSMPTAALPHHRRIPKAFAVRAAGPADARLLERFPGDPAKRRRRLSAGDTCLIAVGDGEVQAEEWIRWGPAEYEEDASRLGVVFAIPTLSCWLHNGGNRSEQVVGPWGLLMGRLKAQLEPRSAATCFLQVGIEDAYSLACHESLGFRPIGRLVSLRASQTRVVGFRPAGGRWTRIRSGRLDLERLGV